LYIFFGLEYLKKVEHPRVKEIRSERSFGSDFFFVGRRGLGSRNISFHGGIGRAYTFSFDPKMEHGDGSLGRVVQSQSLRCHL
jgi:hypothetical protein